MCTSKTSEKMWWNRKSSKSVKAALAIGLAKQLPYSLQMRGDLEEFKPGGNLHAASEYRRIASDLDDPDNPDNTMIVFTPTWARYTDRAAGYRTQRVQV